MTQKNIANEHVLVGNIVIANVATPNMFWCITLNKWAPFTITGPMDENIISLCGTVAKCWIFFIFNNFFANMTSQNVNVGIIGNAANCILAAVVVLTAISAIIAVHGTVHDVVRPVS